MGPSLRLAEQAGLRGCGEISPLRACGAPVEMTQGGKRRFAAPVERTLDRERHDATVVEMTHAGERHDATVIERTHSEGRVPEAPEGRLRAIGVVIAALAVALLLAACAPALAHAEEVDLGISLGATHASPAAGATGAVDLGIAVGTAGAAADTDPADGTLDLGIMVGAARYHEVRFAGWYCEVDGSIDRGRGMETLGEVQRVAAGGRPTAPAGTLRTYDEGGSQLEYWLDGWYAVDPSAHPDAAPVSLDSLQIGEDTVLWCLWKKGYVVKLDANNGTDATAAAKFAGAVAAPGCASVQRDEAYDAGETTERPAGVAYADLPPATRPGYAFKGWYWAETADGTAGTPPLRDAYGRAVLKDGDGDPVAPDASAAGEMSYDFLREHNGQTLYAKWELAPGVRVLLSDAYGPDDDDVYLWYWPGRGYATERPVSDFEATGTLYAGPNATELVDFDHQVYKRPTPASKLFKGWGVKGAGAGAGSGLDGELHVAHERDADADTDMYRLTEAAFKEGWWEDQLDTLLDVDGDGWVEAALDVVGAPVTISVAAPFRVTFDQGEGVPYAPADLTWETGAQEWRESRAQTFTNFTGRPVYVSGLECIDAGASSLLPGGRDGAPIFSLYSGSRADGTQVASSQIAFGYAAGADRVAVDWSSAGRTGCIVLAGTEDAGSDGVETALRYGLDVKAAKFNRAAMAVGNGGAEDAQYTASLANVKYTYALVPED